MSDDENRIREYLKKINPSTLGLSSIRKIKVSKLGLGEAHFNYLASVDGSKFVVRVNMAKSEWDKTTREYNSLKAIESLGIAPKALHLEPSAMVAGGPFIVLAYLEGSSLDRIKRKNAKIIKQLATVIATLHNTSLSGIAKKMTRNTSSKARILKLITREINYIKRKRKIYFGPTGEFQKILHDSFLRLQRLKPVPRNVHVLAHGDIAPQNVIVSSGRLMLIDWEDLGLMDSALEIAIIFDSFDLDAHHMKLFLDEYESLRKDPELRRRISFFWPLHLFETFCWAIMHVYEVGEGEMHKDFLKEQRLENHIAYARKMFLRCRNEGIIDKRLVWRASDIFPMEYLLRS